MFPKNQDKRRFIEECIDIAIECMEEVEQYRALGTVEEIIKHRDNLEQENHEYSCIGTVEELKEAREKQIPKKPRFYAHNYYCTECGNLVGNNEFKWQRFLYCDKCGQAI